MLRSTTAPYATEQKEKHPMRTLNAMPEWLAAKAGHRSARPVPTRKNTAKSFPGSLV
jgi:hypothetical protein